MLIDSLHHQIKLAYCVCFDFYDPYFYLLRKVEDAKTKSMRVYPRQKFREAFSAMAYIQPKIIVVSLCKSLYLKVYNGICFSGERLHTIPEKIKCVLSSTWKFVIPPQHLSRFYRLKNGTC